ncbi:OmpA family protein [Maribacter sp. IgM3_T14_3]|uniref:OmpA family protein n=1 Tax=Maribacter sp. IgM3_T14_3 TaxID=3415140 RepID=UPI003C70481F
MLQKKILLYLSFIVCLYGHSQIAKADRKFKQGDFLQASENYEKSLVKEKTKIVLEQLSICYYNTYNYDRGIEVMKSLVQGDFDEANKQIDAKYNFMYYQFLSATGDYEKAIEQLVAYDKKLGQKPRDVDQSKDMVEAFRLKQADFRVAKANFNSDASDYSAIAYQDSIYFSSDRKSKNSSKEYKWTHRPFLDLYVVTKDSTGKKFGEPILLSKKINSSLHESSLCITKDGTTMYFSRSNQLNGKKIFNKFDNNQVQLYRSTKVDGQWSEPKKLQFCSDEYNYQHPALSPDGKLLYYSTDELGSLGSFDIYKVVINEDGTFGSPKNLGNKINTFNREQFPFVSENGDLFFSSNGHLGLGLLDIYVSKLEDNQFSEPLNLGSPINSRYDDFSLSYNARDRGFFSSNRDNVTDDIFSFEQIGDLFEREYVNTFKIKDSVSQNPVPNATVTLRGPKGDVLYENILDSIAQFTVNLLPGDYEIAVESLGFKTKTSSIKIGTSNYDEHVISVLKIFDPSSIAKNDSDQSRAIIKRLLDDETEPKIRNKDGKLYFDIPYIYFDFDRWQIRKDSKEVLNKLVAKLQNYPSLKIRINSYTDNRGTDKYNQLLSERRAQSTKDYLTEIGKLESKRISFKGNGESKPLVECIDDCTEAMHQKNRRSEFELIEY